MAAEDYIGWYDSDEERPYYILRGCSVEDFTDKAILVKHGEDEDWIPRSQLLYVGPHGVRKMGDVTEIEITEWLSHKTTLPFKMEYP